MNQTNFFRLILLILGCFLLLGCTPQRPELPEIDLSSIDPLPVEVCQTLWSDSLIENWGAEQVVCQANQQLWRAFVSSSPTTPEGQILWEQLFAEFAKLAGRNIAPNQVASDLTIAVGELHSFLQKAYNRPWDTGNVLVANDVYTWQSSDSADMNGEFIKMQWVEENNLWLVEYFVDAQPLQLRCLPPFLSHFKKGEFDKTARHAELFDLQKMVQHCAVVSWNYEWVGLSQLR